MDNANVHMQIKSNQYILSKYNNLSWVINKYIRITLQALVIKKSIK